MTSSPWNLAAVMSRAAGVGRWQRACRCAASAKLHFQRPARVCPSRGAGARAFREINMGLGLFGTIFGASLGYALWVRSRGPPSHFTTWRRRACHVPRDGPSHGALNAPWRLRNKRMSECVGNLNQLSASTGSAVSLSQHVLRLALLYPASPAFQRPPMINQSACRACPQAGLAKATAATYGTVAALLAIAAFCGYSSVAGVA